MIGCNAKYEFINPVWIFTDSSMPHEEGNDSKKAFKSVMKLCKSSEPRKERMILWVEGETPMKPRVSVGLSYLLG
jgi:hypothetical protein